MDMVRSKTGAPSAEDFRAAGGTPIVIDRTVATGGAYYLDDDEVMRPIGWTLSPRDFCEFRLTLTSGAAVTTADVTAATTVYWTPYKGNRVALYDGTNWQIRKSAELSFSVPATTSTMYDVFVYDNSGTPALETLAWTNDTTRATALTLQDGVLVKSGAVTRRYIGSFRTTTVSGKTEDSRAKRYVWNYYNRCARAMFVSDSTDNWSYAVANTFRQANANAANQLDMVVGVDEDAVKASVRIGCVPGGVINVFIAIGLDSTTTMANESINGFAQVASMLSADYEGNVGAGRHTLVWLENVNNVAGATFYGDGGAPTLFRAGMIGEVFG